MSCVVHGACNLILKAFALQHAAFLNPLEEFLGSHQDISVAEMETFGEEADFLESDLEDVLCHGLLDHVIGLKLVGCFAIALNH